MKKNLETYNQKRNFTKTKEPIGKKEPSKRKLRFVVQHHLARKDHYDFRLELHGSLLSFAVPKGPSYNTQDKRLAIHVEDHPLEYRNFEGTIPKGEYGGGTVMIWDEGTWTPLDKDPALAFKNGILKFSLEGKRLKGKWSLIHFKEENWLLRKEKDSVKGFKDIKRFTRSIRTKRTMREIETNAPKRQITKEEMANIEITNPDKIISRNPKITKMDLVHYYQKVLPRMMPFLEKRLMSTIRSPNGMEGEKFYKKHFEASNQNLRKIYIPSDSNKKEDYYSIKNPVGLLQEVQMNGYEFHLWGSKIPKILKPDMLVFDLDPDQNLSLEKVRQGVKDLKSILEELSLVSFLKTSGGKGYHIVVPMTSLKNWKEARDFAQNIAKIMEIKWPLRYTSNVRMKSRKGKIFIDWIRNTKGATSVAPYSVRLKKKLSVSMPIRWSELDKIKPDEITLDLALKRLKRKDPWENFFDISQ